MGVEICRVYNLAKKFLGILFVSFIVMSSCMSTGFCGDTWYGPTFLQSDKEAIDVLNSMRGSFYGSHLYPKQTLEIDKYGLRLFSEYMGTEKRWASLWSWDIITVPILKTEKSGIVFANVNDISVGIYQMEYLGQYYDRWAVVVSPPAPDNDATGNIFAVADNAAAVRFADAVATLAVASGAKWPVHGGGIGALKESWFRQKLNWKKETGAVIKDIVPGSPYQTAGIMGNDILLTFNGNEIKNCADLSVYEAEISNSDTFEVKVPVTLFRAGTILSKEITYFNYNVKARLVQKLLGQDGTAAQSTPAQPKPKFGASVRALTQEDMKNLKLASTAGVLVLEVMDGGTAQQLKLLPNDVIIEVNGIAIKDLSDLQGILANSSISKMKVVRGETVVELTAAVAL